jgi:hypothetical protein
MAMGILDEAIRDHLELKRQHGAENDELKRLEDEAFGPPTRPGEPDFPDSAEASTTNGGAEPTTAEEDAADAERGDAAVADAEPEGGGLEPTTAEEDAADAQPLEAAEHSVVADPSEAETRLYDHALDEDLGLADLGVAPEEESGAPEAAAPSPEVDAEPAEEPLTEEPPAEAAAAEAAPAQEPLTEEPPIESLETVEHPLEPPSEELEAERVEELPSEELAQEPPSEELAHEPPSEEYPQEPPTGGDETAAESEPESSEEDVLADTPEFLRDAPEDDELWFEQGEPKDFDFD